MRPATAMLCPTGGDGAPLLKDGALDLDVLKAMECHDYCISYPPGPNPEGRRALEVLSQAGPTMVAKVTLAHLWPETDTTTFNGALYVKAQSKDALIPQPSNPGSFVVDLSVPGMLDAVIGLIRLHIVMPAQQGRGIPWRGVHIEAQDSSELRRRLHEITPKDWPLWWNSGYPDLAEWRERPVRGVMLENFPFGQATPGDPYGVFTKLRQRQPLGDTDIIFTALKPGGMENPVNRIKLAYGLACAWVFRAVHICAAPEPNDLPWWEYGSLRADLGEPRTFRALRSGFFHCEGPEGDVLLDPLYESLGATGRPGAPEGRGRAWGIR